MGMFRCPTHGLSGCRFVSPAIRTAVEQTDERIPFETVELALSPEFPDEFRFAIEVEIGLAAEIAAHVATDSAAMTYQRVCDALQIRIQPVCTQCFTEWAERHKFELP